MTTMTKQRGCDLYGCDEIFEYLKGRSAGNGPLNKRQVNHWLAAGYLPGKKIGKVWTANTRRIDTHMDGEAA